MIQVTWGNSNKTLLILKFGVRWSRSDYWTASRSARNMIMSVDHTVDILADMSISFSTPQNIIHLVLSGMRSTTDNLGQIVVISPTSLWMRLYQYIKRSYPMDTLPVTFVETKAEVMQILNNYSADRSTQDTNYLPSAYKPLSQEAKFSYV